jgi:hypothetical protein
MPVIKKYILPLTVILLVLLAFVYRQRNSTLDRNESVLPYSENEKVDRIEITDSGNNTLLLNKKDDIWYVEDKNTANPAKVKDLFNILKNIQIQSAVLKNNEDLFSDHLSKTGKTVQLFSNNKLNYEIKFTDKEDRNYAATKSGKLFYISIRGLDATLINKYTNTNPNEWYDKVIINLQPNEISSILLERTDKLQDGFKIENKGNQVFLYNTKEELIENISEESIHDYLNFFSGIQYSLIDTSRQIPNPNNLLFSLQINTNIAKIIHIDGFEMIEKSTLESDKTKFVGIINNSLMVKLNYSDFDPILVERDYFLKK